MSDAYLDRIAEERRRVAAGMKGIPMPEGITAELGEAGTTEDQTQADLTNTDGVTGTDKQRKAAAQAVDRVLDAIEKLEISCRVLDREDVGKVHAALVAKAEAMREHLEQRASARPTFRL